MGVNYITVSKWENLGGKPNLENSHKLEKILNVPKEYLFPDEANLLLGNNKTQIKYARLEKDAIEIYNEKLNLIESETSNPERTYAIIEIRESLEHILSPLTDREREIVKMKYGFTDGKCYTNDEIGQIYGISGSRVNQISKRAIEKMKKRNRRKLAELKILGESVYCV